MDRSSISPPPAYPGEGPSRDCQWKIRSAKYRSGFTTYGEPALWDFREHLECLKESLFEYTRGAGCPAIDPHVVEVQYSQAFTNIEHLISEYQACLRQIKPLQEEEVLFLLLSRFAASSGAAVYTEIRRAGDIQVFDSSILEPLHTNTMADHLAYGAGVINSEISVEPPRELPPSPRTPPPGVSLQDYHTRAPHRAVEVDGSITVNFPEMFAELRPCNPSLSICVAEPPVYQLYQHQQQDSRASPVDWVEIPEKLQPPEFRVHRCHHRGVERSGEGAAFELPFGFPEIVHHLDSTPQNVYHAGFYISNKTIQSVPQGQGAFMAFECHIIPTDIHIYITVEREGDLLAYNCYRDKEVWAARHDNHAECAGCP